MCGHASVGLRCVNLCGGEFWCWLVDLRCVVRVAEWHRLETHTGSIDWIAGPRQAIEVAELGLDGLEGKNKRPVKVLCKLA